MNSQNPKIPNLPDLRGLLWTSFTEELVRLSDIGQPIAQRTSTLDDPLPMAHACIKRAVGIAMGTEALIEAGLAIEAMTLCRGLLEVELVLRAMVLNSDDIRQKLWADWRRGLRGHAKEVSSSLRATASQKKEAERVKNAPKDASEKRLDFKSLSETIADSTPYVAYKKYSLNSSHVSLSALAPYLDVDEESDCWKFVEPKGEVEASSVIFERARSITKLGRAYITLLKIPEETAVWKPVETRYALAILPYQLFRAKSGL